MGSVAPPARTPDKKVTASVNAWDPHPYTRRTTAQVRECEGGRRGPSVCSQETGGCDDAGVRSRATVQATSDQISPGVCRAVRRRREDPFSQEAVSGAAAAPPRGDGARRGVRPGPRAGARRARRAPAHASSVWTSPREWASGRAGEWSTPTSPLRWLCCSRCRVPPFRDGCADAAFMGFTLELSTKTRSATCSPRSAECLHRTGACAWSAWPGPAASGPWGALPVGPHPHAHPGRLPPDRRCRHADRGRLHRDRAPSPIHVGARGRPAARLAPRRRHH